MATKTKKAASRKVESKQREDGDSLAPEKGESITTATVRYKDLCYVLTSFDKLVKENVAFSRIYSFDQGSWGSIDVDWVACSGTVCKLPRERFLALAARGGQVWIVGGGDHTFESLADCQKGFKRKPGIMREIRAIGEGRAYAVGTGRQAYRRDAEGVWACIDKWSQENPEELVSYSFESIDGFAEDDLYTVGWKGEIWHFDGKAWQQLESPTGLGLSKVRCAGDGRVYACGKEGLLLSGRGKKFEILRQKTSEDLWGLEWFDGKLYASSTNLVYSLEAGTLKPVNYGDGPVPGTCYHLSAGDGILWSIGAKDIVEFDGEQWKRVLSLP